MEPVYLDHNATTPIDPEVRAAMLPYLAEEFGNPSSSHAYGRRARAAVERARSQVAELIGARPEEIVFTSGGTEASLIAILGSVEAIRMRQGGGRLRLVSFRHEHPATIRPLERLAERGDDLILVESDASGSADCAAMVEAIGGPPSAALVSLMLAHNETGVLQPVEAVGVAARARRCLFHVDAAQAVGKLPVDVERLGCDLLTVAGHKLYAPKGVGALYIRDGTEILPPIPGAGQEKGLRGGTENVPGIVGLGAACNLAARQLREGEPDRLSLLRERLWSALRMAIPGIRRTAEGASVLPNTLHVRFPGASGNAVLAATPGVAASTGSACHSGIDRAPAAILALGISEEDALGSVRLSLGHASSAESVDLAARLLVQGWLHARDGGNPDGPRG